MPDLGANLRDEGMAAAAEAQDRASAMWTERAYRAIVAVARKQSTVHVDDVLVEFHDIPTHPNAWGQVWRRALKSGVLGDDVVGMRTSDDPLKHRHRYPVYRSLMT